MKLRDLWRLSKDSFVAAWWRQQGVKLQGRCMFWGRVPRLQRSGSISLGNQVQFAGADARSSLTVAQGASLTIGDYTFINGGTRIDAADNIKIGRNCLIGHNAVLQDSSSHEVDEGGEKKIKPISIGNNVWIARNAIILPGVDIGDHSVVAAGCIVTKSFPAKSMIAGNPGKLIRNIVASDNFVR